MTEPMTLVKGTLDVLVLKALSWGPMHGFEVTTWLERQSSGAVGVDDSALYQSLYRLEARGHVEAEWGVTDNKRRARYYTLTKRGRAELKAETTRLLRYTTVLASVLMAPARSQ